MGYSQTQMYPSNQGFSQGFQNQRHMGQQGMNWQGIGMSQQVVAVK